MDDDNGAFLVALPLDLHRQLQELAFRLDMKANELAVDLIEDGFAEISRMILAELMGLVPPDPGIDHTPTTETRH